MTRPDIIIEIDDCGPHSGHSLTLEQLCEKVRGLKPSRVWVDSAGPLRLAKDFMRDALGRIVESMPKSFSFDGVKRVENTLVFDLHDWMVASDDDLDGVVLMVRRPTENL
jgi:hypothetical protein